MTDAQQGTVRSAMLRNMGLRVTRQRLAVLSALESLPHAGADTVITAVRHALPVSTQTVYDVLHTLTERGLVRRIQPSGSVARYELRVGDNHHHLVCRSCGTVVDIDCATGSAPCLDPADLPTRAPGFAMHEAEVTYWGQCSTCTDTGTHPRPDTTSQPEKMRRNDA
jgi:Fe2+ or Zn2+ uptake regulation protein